MVAKSIMVVMEQNLGRVINREPTMRKVFAAAFMQGLRHLDEMPDIVDSLRMIKFTGKPADLDEFVSKNHNLVARLNDADRSQIVAAGMLRGNQPTHYFSSTSSTHSSIFFRSHKVWCDH